MLRLFSADDHIIEHPKVWTSRLAVKYRDRGPRVISEDGKEYWYYEDTRVGSVNGTIGNGAPAAPTPAMRQKSHANEPRVEVPHRFSEMMPSAYDPSERAKDLLSNGVVASVCFPTLPKFSGTLFLNFPDRALGSECVRAYNDFILDEWCPGGPPGLYVPMILCQLWDIEAAVREVERCASRGARALSLPENVVGLNLPSFWTDYWSPLWKACEDAEIVICMHIGTGGNYEQYRPSPEAPEAVLIAVAGVSMSAGALINIVFSPICSQFPGLRFVMSESGIGWLPYAIARSDLVWERYQNGELPERKPSDIWRENMYVCQVEEHIGLKFLDYIGADRVLWELDFPHPDTVWPFTQEHTRTVFREAGTATADIDRITYQNSVDLFRWAPAELSTPVSV